MGIEVIGKQIASMRKERGKKQEELALFVGVSTQAVSKWENGGVPDTELLPKIADFFEVSVDTLFGRSITDYSDLQTALCKKIIDTPPENRMKLAFDFCWDIERALCGEKPKGGNIEEYENEIPANSQQYSSMIFDSGFTRMGTANIMQYFLIVPEPKDIGKAYLDGVDYVSFMKTFSDPDVFNACVMLYRRESEKAFTPNLLVKNLGMDPEKAKHVLSVLQEYHFVSQTAIEMDDEIQTIYNFKPTPSFIAFLIFAKELIQTPNVFSYYCVNRNKPFLK